MGEKDRLGWVRLTSGNDDIILVTRKGQALRFAEKEIRSMGRQAAGVTGIRLKGDDKLTSMDVIEPGGQLLVVSEYGYGKRTNLDEYPKKSRATGGVATTDLKNLSKIGHITSARVVQEVDEFTIISSGGIMLRLKVKDISSSGRATRGFKMMDLGGDDRVASVARINTTEVFKAENDTSQSEK